MAGEARRLTKNTMAKAVDCPLAFFEVELDRSHCLLRLFGDTDSQISFLTQESRTECVSRWCTLVRNLRRLINLRTLSDRHLTVCTTIDRDLI
jgi:hypothetical protein